MRTVSLLIPLWCLGISTCGNAPAERLVDEAALAATEQGGDWLAFGRAYDEQRFSPLKSIDETNVGKLRVAW